jgi:hypothetical protein
MLELVECRSDWEYAQRPQAFTWQGQRLGVQQVISQFRTPDGTCFLISTFEADCFNLFYNEHLDQWIIQPTQSKESA